MDLLQLKYFLRLAETQHVTKTAQELNISQPSLSITVKKLEKELGAPLFVREGRNIELSPYGKAFREYVEEAFLALENGRRAVYDLWNQDSLSLTVGLLDPFRWKDFISDFSLKNPDVSLNILSVEDSSFSENLVSGRIDLYLGGMNDITPAEDMKLATDILYEDEMAVMMPVDHPFAGRSSIDLRELKEESFINMDAGSNLQIFINELFRQAGFMPKVSMICASPLRFVMLEEGHGLVVTTRKAAARHLSKAVSYVVLSYPAEKRRVGLVWHKKRIVTSAMTRFIEFAQDHYRNEKEL